MGKQADTRDGVTMAASDHHLVVVHPFGSHNRGDAITDPAEIAAVLAGENAHHCRKVFPQ